MKQFCTAFARRPFDSLLFASMFIVGVLDMFSYSPFPPEIQDAAPPLFFMVYGLYLALGSALILAAIFNRLRVWSSRAERLGLLLIAGATAVSGVVLTRWISLDPQAMNGESEVNHAAEITITKYVIICIVIICIGCIARWKFLGRVNPVGLTQRGHE